MRKIYKKLSLFALGVLCCATCVSGGLFSAHTEAETTLSTVDIEEEYTIGETVTVPDATITVDGTAYEATKTLVYPNGNTAAVDSAVMRMSGEYQIVYKAMVDGKLYEETVTFLVLTDRYSVSSENSSVKYGTNSYLGDMQGLNLTLAQGDTFTYNRVINLNEVTQAEELIRFYYTPAVKGEGEVNQTYIVLTDIYNPDNFVRVQYNSRIHDVGYAWDRLFISAGANGQDLKGMEYSPKNGSLEYEGNIYRLHVNNFFGMASQSSWTGELTHIHETFAENYNYLQFDYAARKLYAHPYNFYKSRNMIVDLDEPLIYGDNLWQGFTTGEVIMSIHCENYASTEANFFISDIIDGELAETPFKDEVSPDIVLDMQGYSETDLPKAYINKPYRIFDATAYDNLEGVKQVEVNVYYNYHGSGRSLVQITDGVFTPKRTGEYTIVYTAKDSLGNIGRKMVEVACETRTNALGVVFGVHAETCEVMSQVAVAKYGVLNANGQSKVRINAVLKDDPTVNVEIDPVTRVFTPEVSGMYEIVYTVNDYTDTATAKYELEVETVAFPVFNGEPLLPKYLIKGCNYTFETPNAYDYSGETVEPLDIETYIKEDVDTTETKLNGLYTVTASNTLTLVYKATNGNGVSSKEYVIPVVDVKYGDMANISLANYFQGDGFTAVIDEEKTAYTKAYDNASTANLNFVNAVNVNEYSFNFSLSDGLCNFSSLDVLLTGKDNATEVLKITFTVTDGRLNFFVNDYSVKTFSFFHTLGEEIEVYYNRSENLVMVNSDYSFDLDTEKDVFEGFSGNLAYMTVRFNGVRGDIGLNVNKLLKQLFTTGAMDFGTPAILSRATENTAGTIGETISIIEREYFDLLDAQLKIEFSVYGPNDEVMLATDGTELSNADPYRDYEIELYAYGAYYVQYKATDFSGNVARYGYQISVRDFTPPTAEITGDYETSCKVDDTVAIADITAMDDNGDATWYAVVIKPNGDVQYITDGEFRAEVKGEYQVYYTIFDENGNASQIYYVVTAY